MSDLTVNDDGPNRLLGQIVGGSNRGIDQKAQVRAPVFVQTMGDILGFSGQLFFRNQGSQVSLNDRQCLQIVFLGHRVAKMPEIKEPLELTQQPDSELLIGNVANGFDCRAWRVRLRA